MNFKKISKISTQTLWKKQQKSVKKPTFQACPGSGPGTGLGISPALPFYHTGINLAF